jgi:hypothetical protein
MSFAGLIPNNAPCVIGVIYAHCASVKYTPSTCFPLARYSLACSSDQKKVEFRQYESMIVRSLKLSQSTSGVNTSGFAPASPTEVLILLSMVMCSLCWQCLHSVSTSTATYSLRSCPCTKGVATASSAQAAYSRSPLLNLSLCGVLSAVTG